MESGLCLPSDPGFRLIETFLWTPDAGVQRHDLHLARLFRTASRFGISAHGVDAALSKLDGPHPLRVRLTVDATGNADISTAPFAALPRDTVWTLGLSDVRLKSSDPWLGVKTTKRDLYDNARAALPAGVDEVIFLNEREEVCEGTITNIFVDFGDGLVTPPLSSGVLPGVCRRELIESRHAREQVVTIEMLNQARRVLIGNSLRGLISARF